MSVKPETVAAIKSDPFAFKAIEATIKYVYVNGRDWDNISTTGKILFKSEDDAMAYCALCALVGRTDPPDVGDVRVHGIGAAALDELCNTFNEGTAKRKEKRSHPA